MKTLSQQLGQYALYHRSSRNILTHLLGIPLIVLAVIILLSRPAIAINGITLSPAVIGILFSSLYYLKLDLKYGLVMTALLLGGLQLATIIAASSTAIWLGSGIGLFVIGWTFQFIGHAFEGKKPAFVDDLIGLVIGPLFIVAEIAFFLGLSKTLQQDVEQQAGPIRN